jgi:hypothetical protein
MVHHNPNIRLLSRLAAGLMALSASFLLAGARASVPEVGQVTLTIGRAMVISGSGEPAVARRGSPIHAGDRVETDEGGHVHIRFVDGALVSVRPTSRLVVENYQYDPALPAQSTVRFRLDQGTTRAISGAAAQAAKERFRLNTPLVAIGVRGTDFVVTTQAGQTLATVNQGAIVMAPLGAGCSPQALGPCASNASRYLSADMGRVFAEFSAQSAQAEIKPLLQLPVAEASGNSKAASTGRRLVSGELDSTGAAGADAVRRVVGEGAVLAAQHSSVPVADAAPVAPSQLAWGRWGAATAATDFALARAEAREGRHATVGNDYYLLYREGSAVADLQPNLGNVAFTLQQSHAQLVTPGAVLPASVAGGTLQMNFPARQFATTLNVTSVPTGAVALGASGFIRSDGIFVSRTADQAIAGAAALDGKTAGYLFEKATPAGALTGITLWGR